MDSGFDEKLFFECFEESEYEQDMDNMIDHFLFLGEHSFGILLELCQKH